MALITTATGLFTTYRVASSVYSELRRWGLDPASLVFGGSSSDSAAKNIFAGSFTSVLALGAGRAALSSLYNLLGGASASATADAMQAAFWSRAPPPQQPPKTGQATTHAWDEWHAMGTARDTAQFISEHSTAVMLLFLSLSLQYLHFMGAYEMQRKLKARAATQPTAAAPTTDPALSTLRTIANAQARQTRRQPVTATTGLVDAESAAAGDGLLEGLLRDMYLNDGFYNPKPPPNASRTFFTVTPTRVNPVRYLVNVLLGFSMQLNALVTGSSELQGVDPIAAAARVSAAVAYWELLTRALHMYGWAPTYVAVQQVARLMLLINKKQAYKNKKPQRR